MSTSTTLASLAESLSAFMAYLEDYRSQGGGWMARKYGDDQMKGFDNVVERFRPIARQAKSLSNPGASS